MISRGTTEPLSREQVDQLGRTLGRTYAEASFDRYGDKQVSVLTINGIRYSISHQGAGEDSVLDLLALVAEAPAKSLVIIDEVEASLHPQAQRGLVTELLRLAHDKRLQIIMSTHSPYILEQLPNLARVVVSVDRHAKRNILYGVSTNSALNLMDDERHEELDVYCEDDESAYLIERLVAIGAPMMMTRTRITAVGPANTVMTLGAIANKRRLARPAVCVVDAEQNASDDYLLLPDSLRRRRPCSIWTTANGRPWRSALDAQPANFWMQRTRPS